MYKLKNNYYRYINNDNNYVHHLTSSKKFIAVRNFIGPFNSY